MYEGRIGFPFFPALACTCLLALSILPRFIFKSANFCGSPAVLSILPPILSFHSSRIRLARLSSPVQTKPSIHLASASALGHYNIILLRWHILLFPGPIVYFHTRLQHPNTTLPPVQDVQGGWGGWPTGNGKKRSSSQACCLAQLCLAVASFLSISCGPSAL